MKKLSMSLLLLAIMILSISVVSATDADVSADLTSAPDDAAISAANDASVLADPDLTFKDLRTAVDDGGSEIVLNKNYTYSVDSDMVKRATVYKEGIFIDKNCTIDGQGNYIDCADGARAFRINSFYSVTLKNIKFKNVNTTLGAVYTTGKITLQNCIFECSDGSIYDDSNATDGPVTISNNPHIYSILEDEASYNEYLNDPSSPLNKYYYNYPREDGIDVNGQPVHDLNTIIVGHNWNATIHADTMPPGYSTYPWIILDLDNYTGLLEFKYDNEVRFIWTIKEKSFAIVSVPDDLGLEEFRLEWGTGESTKKMDPTKLEVLLLNDFKPFKDLRSAIDGATDVLMLDADYAYDASVDDYDFEDAYQNRTNRYVNGVFIAKNLIIDGQGHMIDASAINRALIIYPFVNVTLKNIIIVNGKSDKGRGIYQAGNLTLENCTFIDYKGGNKDDVYNDTTAVSSGSVYKSTVDYEHVYYIYNESSYNVLLNDPASPLNYYYYKYPREDGIDVNGKNVENLETYVAGHNWNASIHAWTVNPHDPAIQNTTFPWVVINGIGFSGDLVFKYDDVVVATDTLSDRAFKIYSVPNDLNMPEYMLKWGTGQSGTKVFDPAKMQVLLQMDTVLTVHVDNIKLGENAIVNVTLKDINGNNVTGTVNVTIAGTPYAVTVTNGVGSRDDISGLTINTYEAFAEFLATDNYAYSNATTTFSVGKGSSIVTVPAVSFVYNESKTVIVTVTGTTGAIHAQLLDTNGTPITIGNVTVNGKQVTVSGLPAGNYKLNVTADEDDNYESATGQNDVVVSKATSSVTVPAYTEVAYGGIVVVSVSDLVNASGVTAKLYNGDAEVGAVSVSGNDITVNVAGLSFGTYTLNVTTVTDANHANVTKSGIINVTGKGTPNLGVDDIAPITYGDASISIKANYTGNYNITVDNGDVINVDNIVAGQAKTVSIGVLAAGSHTVKVQFKGDDNYNPSNVVSKDLTVKPATATITLTGTTSIIYGQNTTITATTTHAKAITAKLDGNNVPVSGFNVTVAPGAGSHNLTVTTVPENSNYTASSANVTIVVAKATSSVDVPVVSFIYGGSQTVTVTVVNSTGAIHAQLLNTSGRPVIVGNATVKGKEVTVSGLPVGYYTLVVTVDADDNYESATGDNIVIVNAKSTSNVTVPPISFDYGESGTVTVTVTGTTGAIHAQLLDTNGTPLTIGKAIVNGKKVTVSDLPVGNYILNVTADADDRYEGASGNNSVVVSKAPSSVVINNIIDGAYKTVAANVDYTVTNRTTVTFKIGNKTGVVVNETAIDQLEAKLFGLNVGNYTITIINAENDNYYGDEDSANFTVTKGYVNMAITSKDVVYPNDVVVTVISDVSGNYSLFKGITSPKYIVLEAGVAKEVNFTDMDAGTYEFALVYLETEYYNTGRKAVNVTVDKANVNMAITSKDVVYPNDVVVTVMSDVSGNYSLYLDTTSPRNIVLEAGVAQEVNFSKVDAGTHEFTLAYLETQNYKAANKSVSVNIAKGNVNMTITAKDVIYPNDVVLTLLSDVSGNYSLYKGITAPQYIDLEAGVAKEVKFSKLDVDTYEFTLVYFETQNYKTSMESVNVDVSKGNVTINISASDVTYPDDIILNLLSDVSGTYDLYLGSVAPFKINLEAGVVKTLEYAEFEAGTHEFTLAYLGSTNYNPARESINVTVSKGNVNMNITAKDVTYPDDIILNLLSDVSGTYDLYLGSVAPFKINLEAGVVKTLECAEFEAGTHEFTLAYLGSTNYNPARESINVTVSKGNVNMNITAKDVTYPDDVVLTLLSDVSGNYSLFKGITSPQYVVLEAGVAKEVKFSKLDAGTYEFALVYLETENYTTGRTAINVTVNKVENTTMSINVTTPVATENATVTVTLPADATGNVSVKYGNGVYFADVVNGTAIVSVPTTVAGTETADVIYSGDNNYASLSSEVNITVKVQGVIIAENIKRGVNSSYDYYATLVNAEGQPISDVEITFTIEGKTYKAKTNASGIATVSAGLVVKDGKDTVYNVTVTNPYTFENTTATTTIVPRLIVVSGDLTADYLENPPYIVQAIGDDGEHVGANVTVRIVFAGFYYDLQTNETGHVVRTIALAPGSYAVRGEYLGYKTEQTPFQVLQILQASSGTLKKKTAKTYTLKATLKHTNGKAIANAEVKLNFNGKNYKVKTNSKGVASYTLKSSQISKLQAGKTYILKALYINDWTKGKWQGKIKVVNK